MANISINRVILVGRMAVDPELRYTPSGVAVANFRLAVDRPFTSSQGEKQADFINVVAWRQQAQFAADYLRKGRLVGVEGRLQVRSFTTSDGQRRWMTEVVAERVQALDRAREEERAGAAAGPAGEAPGEGPGMEEAPDAFEGQ